MKSPHAIGTPEYWKPPPAGHPRDVVYAIKALAAGKASAGQQTKALSYIVYVMCGVTSLAFDPRTEKVDGRRVTDFRQGQQSIGLMLSQIVAAPVKGQGDQEIPSEAGIEPQTRPPDKSA